MSRREECGRQKKQLDSGYKTGKNMRYCRTERPVMHDSSKNEGDEVGMVGMDCSMRAR